MLHNTFIVIVITLLALNVRISRLAVRQRKAHRTVVKWPAIFARLARRSPTFYDGKMLSKRETDRTTNNARSRSLGRGAASTRTVLEINSSCEFGLDIRHEIHSLVRPSVRPATIHWTARKWS